MMKKLLLILLILCTSISKAQVSAEIPTPQIKCDINNPGDMVEIFNLRDSEAEIITGQTNVVVTYHETSGDALGNGGVIPNPETFENLPPEQIIFVRVENESDVNDWQVTTMEVIVRQPPEPLTTEPDPLVEDETSGDGDGFAIFDLTEIEEQLFSDPFAQDVLYYLTTTEADTQTNPIATPTEFANTINPQEIYARAQSAPESECSVVVAFQVVADETLAITDTETITTKLFPNPASEHITLSSNAAIVKASIYDISGKVVSTKESNDSIMTIDITVLNSGIYFVQVDDMSVVKFVKK